MSTSCDLADVFSIAPSLRELIIPSETDYGGSWHAQVPLPWSHITHFRGHYDMSEEALKVLVSVSKVVECGITIKSDNLMTSDTPHVALEHLRRLKINAAGYILRSSPPPTYRRCGSVVV
jgi:hypothetical protein